MRINEKSVGAKKIAVVVFSLLTAACSNVGPTGSPENVVEAACEALVDNDEEAFNAITITAADFILKDEGMSSVFRQKMSYAGSQLKPEEMANQKAEFRRAAAEFRDASCDGAQLRGSETRERMDGGALDLQLYAVVVDDKPRDAPLFEVVAWDNQTYRLLGLKFPDESASDVAGEPGVDGN